jgi:hypothetical protein
VVFDKGSRGDAAVCLSACWSTSAGKQPAADGESGCEVWKELDSTRSYGVLSLRIFRGCLR